MNKLQSECFICPSDTTKCAHFGETIIRLRFPSKTSWVVERIENGWHAESHYCCPKPGHLFDHMRDRLVEA